MLIDQVSGLQYFNHFVGQSSDIFRSALFLSDRLPWLLYALTLCSMWYAGTVGLLPERPGGLLRSHARYVTLLTLVAMPPLFVVSKVIQKFVESTRPMLQEDLLLIPLPPKEWQTVIASFDMQGSFPSDHAVVFFLLATVIFALNFWWGMVALAVVTFFSLLRVAVGFHWPMDVLVGALIGMAAGAVILVMVRFTEPRFVRWTQRPMKLWLVAALFYLFLYDCSYKFNHIMGLMQHGS